MEFPCHTTSQEEVEWGVRNTPVERKYERIYSTDGIVARFDKTGRYSVKGGNGSYILSISNVTFNETGEYICKEDEGDGLEHIFQLNVTSQYNIGISNFASKLNFYSK